MSVKVKSRISIYYLPEENEIVWLAGDKPYPEYVYIGWFYNE